jgi:murein DD-endopeptidase MepM/ murein hydrolase activator NlpD
MGNNKYFKDLGYEVTSTYDWRVIDGKKEFHPGVDLKTKPQGPIKAFTEGTVVWAGEATKPGTGYGSYGIAVGIKDKNGCIHVYGHMLSTKVKVGDKVAKDQVIGVQGNTGRSFGTARNGYLAGEHLHYEVRKSATVDLDPDKKEHRCYVPDEYLEKFYSGKAPSVPAPAKLAATAKPASAPAKTYTIKAGDTLSEIATTHKTTVANILKLNPEIKDASKVRAGQTIKLG